MVWSLFLTKDYSSWMSWIAQQAERRNQAVRTHIHHVNRWQTAHISCQVKPLFHALGTAPDFFSVYLSTRFNCGSKLPWQRKCVNNYVLRCKYWRLRLIYFLLLWRVLFSKCCQPWVKIWGALLFYFAFMYSLGESQCLVSSSYISILDNSRSIYTHIYTHI